MNRRSMFGLIWFAVATGWVALLTVGCGPTPSQRETLQSIMENRTLSEEEKLARLALAIFAVVDIEITPGEPDGQAVRLAVRSNDDDVIRQVMDGKPAEQLQRALKEFHFKLLNPQIAEYLRRARDMHLRRLTISLQPVRDSAGQRTTFGEEQYRLVLDRERFEAYLQVANLRAQDALPQAEKIWRVEVDQFQ